MDISLGGGSAFSPLYGARGTTRPEIAGNVTHWERAQRGGDSNCDAALCTGAEGDKLDSMVGPGCREMSDYSREVFCFVSVLLLMVSLLAFHILISSYH